MPPQVTLLKRKVRKAVGLSMEHRIEKKEEEQSGEHDKNDEVVRENWGGSVEWWMRLNHSTGWELMDFQVRAQW